MTRRTFYVCCFIIGLALAMAGIDLPLWLILLPWAIVGALHTLEDHLAHR